MLNVSGLEAGKNDTVLVQAKGSTGDQSDRDIAMAKALHSQSKAKPEGDQAQVYNGDWKPV